MLKLTPIKKIPQPVIEADARWLDESHAIHFTIEELNKRGLKFKGSIHDLLKFPRCITATRPKRRAA